VVLSVVVTLRIQHEQPGIEQPGIEKPAPERTEERAARQLAEPVKPAAEPVARAPQPKSMMRKEAQAFPSSPQDREAAEDRVAAAVPPRAPVPAEATPPVPAPATAPAPRMEEAPALAKRADSGAPPAAGQRAGSVAESSAPAADAPVMGAMQRDRVAAERAVPEQRAPTPEKELERIAGLRKQGRHDEADKALAEFHKRYPDFKLTEAMRERVERR